jgi:lipopolysaccharide/colanic/teichoic acid biosynthesis glycosyltransferase
MFNIFNFQISIWSMLLLLGDVAAFCLALPLGIYVGLSGDADPWFFLDQYTGPLMLMGLAYILVLYIANLYDHYEDFRRRENISRVILSCLVGTVVVLTLFSLRHILPGKFVEWHGIGFIWLTVLWRYSFSAVALPVRLQRKALIVGAGYAGRWIAEAIKNQPNCGLAVKGFVDDDPQKVGATLDGFEVLGPSNMLEELIRQKKIGLVVVGITDQESTSFLITLNRIFLSGCQVMDIPSLYEFLEGKIPIDHITAMWIYFKHINYRGLYYPNIKGLMDLILACLCLVISWPIFILIALAIKLDSPGPIFFRQMRLGHNNKPFQIIKFRTMTTDADKDRPQWTSLNDHRITRVGNLLRKMHLDELPQLINILKGEMSVIGPRAEWDVFAQQSQELVAEWRPGRRASDPPDFKVLTTHREQIPFYSFRLLVKPGVTGWAQVMFPHAGSSMEEMKEKLQLDLYYMKNMGLLLDLAILMKTIRIVLFGHGK